MTQPQLDATQDTWTAFTSTGKTLLMIGNAGLSIKESDGKALVETVQKATGLIKDVPIHVAITGLWICLLALVGAADERHDLW